MLFILINENAKVFPADDPFWDYYYPIKAYGCHCTVIAYDKEDIERLGLKVEQPPAITYVTKFAGNRSGNGQILELPIGYDVGFAPHNTQDLKAYRLESIDKVIMNKMIDAEPTFASRAITSLLNAPEARFFYKGHKKWVDDLAHGDKNKLKAATARRLVGVIDSSTLKALSERGIMPESAVIAMEKGDMLHAIRESKKAKGIDVPLSFWQQLPQKLQQPDAILLQKSTEQRNSNALNTLLFIYNTEQGKIAVKLDYIMGLKNLDGKRRKVLVNLVRTGSRVDLEQIKQQKQMLEIIFER